MSICHPRCHFEVFPTPRNLSPGECEPNNATGKLMIVKTPRKRIVSSFNTHHKHPNSFILPSTYNSIFLYFDAYLYICMSTYLYICMSTLNPFSFSFMRDDQEK